MFVHTVYFYLKPSATAAARDQLVNDCRTYLAKIPGVKNLWAGVPAMTPREVVDNSYGVGLTVVMEDVAGHDVYQEHPLHADFIKRNKETWDRVQIYDYLT
jgi:hypothetical protein